MDPTRNYPGSGLPECERSRSEPRISGPNSSYSCPLVLRRRRLITVGLTLFVASTAAHQGLQSHRGPNDDDPQSGGGLVRSGRFDRRGFFRAALHLAHLLPDARGLGVPVRRRQCKGCHRVRCLCVFWRVTCAVST